MHTRTLVTAIAITLVMRSSTMSSEVDIEAEKAAVAEVVTASIKWCFPDKDRVRMLASYVREPYFMIFHPDSASTMHGFDAFAKYAETVFMNEACQPKGSKIRDLKVNLSKAGDAAWYSCILDDWGEWDGKPWNWKNTRWTGVLEKVDGKWLIAQMHFSFPSDAKDDTEGDENSEHDKTP